MFSFGSDTGPADTMKGKLNITKHDLEEASVNSLAYHKVNEDSQKIKTRSNSIGQESVDFETAINKAGYGKFHYLLLLIAVPASCSSGFVTGAVSLILPAAGCDLDLSSFEKGLLNSAPYAGMVASAFFWGFLSDSFGRQRLLMIGFLVDATMSFSASISPSFIYMIFFKFLSGIMVCGPYSIFMAYISEVFMDKRRDIAVLSAGIFSSLGNIFQPVMAMLLMRTDIYVELIWGLEITPWRLFLMACAIPSLVCGISSAFCVESPKFLMEQGRQDEALNVFQKIYTINTGLPTSTYPVHKLHDSRSPSVIANSGIQEKKTFVDMLKDGFKQTRILLKPPFLPRALFLFFIQFGAMSSLNVLRLWLPQMFTLVEMTSNSTSAGSICEVFVATSNQPAASCEDLVIKPEVFSNMAWVNAGSLFAHGIFIIIVKYVGKKIIIIGTAIVAAVCVILIPFFPSQFVVPLASVYLAVLNIEFYSVVGTVVETFPTKIRATTVSLTMMFGRIGVLIANVGVSGIMYTHCDSIFYSLFILLTIIGVSSIFLPTQPLTSNSSEEANKHENDNNNVSKH